jgi:hypothetical protein
MNAIKRGLLWIFSRALAGLDMFGRLIAGGIRFVRERLDPRITPSAARTGTGTVPRSDEQPDRDVPTAVSTVAGGVAGAVVTVSAGRAFVAHNGWSGLGVVGRQVVNGRSVPFGAGVSALVLATNIGMVLGFVLGAAFLARVFDDILQGVPDAGSRHGSTAFRGAPNLVLTA